MSLCWGLHLYATHNRAGEIIYRQLNNLTYEATVITYTKIQDELGRPSVSRDSLEVFWGDGTSDKLPRSRDRELIDDNILRNEYKGTHTYNGPATYTISMSDPNRINEIINIKGGLSVEIVFYIESELVVLNPQFYGFNNSPIILEAPVAFGVVDRPFVYNPNAFDLDGDKLVYEIVAPKQAVGVDVPEYQSPNEIGPGNNSFEIDPNTGEIRWENPTQEGIYNVAIKITEYREGIKTGSVLRDMQFIIFASDNKPPVLNMPEDICVLAGEEIFVRYRSYDQDPGDKVTLSATGGPFEVSNSALFPVDENKDTALSNFSWRTSCEHIREEYYKVVVKAEDNFRIGTNPQPLSTIHTWQIKVVGPPPENLLAEPSRGVINLSWDSIYSCANTRSFKGFTIWRKLGGDAGEIDTCQTPGLLEQGYEKIEQLYLNYSYVDVEVEAGFEYCYRITAEFGSGSDEFPYNRTQSLPSNRVCSKLKQDIPIMSKVSVLETSTNRGVIEVGWTKPLAEDLDTNQNPGPYEYRIHRSVGYEFPSTLIKTIRSNTFSGLVDTMYLDSALNTFSVPYSYRIEFYVDDNFLLGSNKEASSILVETEPTDNQINLSWEEQVPWENEIYYIYRRSENESTFRLIGSSMTQNYSDLELANGREYCYFVESYGTYGAVELDSLINVSQIVCDTPVDNVRPCIPNVSITNACDQRGDEVWNKNDFNNQLEWQLPFDSCIEDVSFYRIYWAKDSSNQEQVIHTTPSRYDSTYKHDELFSSLAGCYTIVAVDSYDNESLRENTICIDNCPLYQLPNVFTPNGDNANDLYTPYENTEGFTYRFIDHVDFKVYNKWGQLVYQTQDPSINWDGKHIESGKVLPEATYYYGCEIYEKRIDGVIERKEPIKGFIHLIVGEK